MSAVWPIPEDLRDSDYPNEYLADDVDEMATGSLAVLAAVRRRIEDALVWDTQATQRVLTVVDEYAREVRDDARDRDNEEETLPG